MKKFWLIMIMVLSLILILFLNRIEAQTTSTKPNQVELMKQFIGTWRADYAKDTIVFWDAKSYGTGLECNYRFVYKEKIVKEGKQLWGYDTTIDKYVAVSLPKGMDLEIDVYWFISTDKCEARLYNDINEPETASSTWVIKFTSPDRFIETVTEINKPDRIINYTRIK